MSTDMKIALIGVGAAIIGGLCSTCTTIWLTNKQVRLANNTAKLEVLQKRIEKLESVFRNLSSVRVDLDPGLSPDQITAKIMDAFGNHVSAFSPCMHYFPKQLEDDLNGLHDDMKRCMLETKYGVPLDKERADRVRASLAAYDKRMFAAIAEKLRELHMKISSLTDSGD